MNTIILQTEEKHEKEKMLIGVLMAAMLLGNVSPAMVQGAQAAEVTEVPAETETEELATESAVTETKGEEMTETAVTETEEQMESGSNQSVSETQVQEATETSEDVIKVEEVEDENGFIIDDGILTGYYGSGGDIVIPEGVTSIEERVFQDCNSITSVSIPGSVTDIGNLHFFGAKI